MDRADDGDAGEERHFDIGRIENVNTAALQGIRKGDLVPPHSPPLRNPDDLDIRTLYPNFTGSISDQEEPVLRSPGRTRTEKSFQKPTDPSAPALLPLPDVNSDSQSAIASFTPVSACRCRLTYRRSPKEVVSARVVPTYVLLSRKVGSASSLDSTIRCRGRTGQSADPSARLCQRTC